MLHDILQAVGRFTTEDCVLFENHLVKKQVKKNDLLLKEGEICREVFYIVSGSVYEYSDAGIDENIIDLHSEKEWLLQYESFVAQKPSPHIIKAYTDCELLALAVTQLHQLIALSPAFLQMGRILEKGLARTYYFDNALTPAKKYQHLLQTKPQLLQAFPLKLIASYLKITPETLSRVRSAY